MFYAIWHPYGIRTASKGDTLYRYANKRLREEDAERVDWQGITDGRGFLMEEVTRAEARRQFPAAFRADAETWDGWRDGDRHFDGPWWRDDGCGSQEWTGSPTGGVYAYM